MITIEELCAKLGFGTDNERFYAWVRSSTVKPFWNEYYQDWFSKRLDARQDRRGAGFKTVMEICEEHLSQNRG